MDMLQYPTDYYVNTDLSKPSKLTKTPINIRRTRLVIALADSNVNQIDIQKMMEAGMNAVRLMAGHLTNEEKIKLLDIINRAASFLAKKHGVTEWPCATCLDLKSCVLRTGLLEMQHPITILRENTDVILTNDMAIFNKCNEHQIFIDDPYIFTEVTIGMEISIEQDEIVLQVQKIGPKTVMCIVIKGGELRNMVLVCLRGAKRSHPRIAEFDLKLLELAKDYQVDMIFINYVRHVETIKKVKEYLGINTKKPLIVCGICTLEGLYNLDDIIPEADTILFSRELLAYELDRTLSYRMNSIQKWVAGKCRQVGKPMFVSGQIFYNTFESGVADVRDSSDVANALLDGASGFVLRHCTDSDTLITVMTGLSELCIEMEPYTNNKIDFYRQLSGVNVPLNAAMAAAVSCALAADQSQSRVIVTPTVSGRTIYYLNYMRPFAIILAVTTNMRTFRLAQVYRGVVALLYEDKPQHTWHNTIKARVDYAIDYAIGKNWLEYGDCYITLEKGRDDSIYCDTVRICTVQHKNNFIMCILHSETNPTTNYINYYYILILLICINYKLRDTGTLVIVVLNKDVYFHVGT